MDELSGIKLVEALRMISGADRRKPDTMVLGTVKTIDPLSVEIGDGVVLTEEFLFLGQMCRPHKVTIPHTHIVDTHFTEKSPSIGSVGAGLIAGTAFEQAQSSAAKAKMNNYTVLDGDGNEVKKQVSDSDLGRGSVSTSIAVSGQAAVVDDSVTITDNGHIHLIDRQLTKDVHFPKSDYEESVTIEIEPKLKKGDTVLMFAFNNFQKFYVAERIEKED